MSPFRLLCSLLASSRHRILQHRLPHGRHRAMALAAAALGGVRRMSLYNFKADDNHDDNATEKSVVGTECMCLHYGPMTCKPINHHQEEVQEQDEILKEKAMKERFEEWMIKYGRTYKDEKEKATRYEIFRDTARFVDDHNARRRSRCESTFETNDFADRTKQELRWLCGGAWRPDDYRG